jgi:hypothetical protein
MPARPLRMVFARLRAVVDRPLRVIVSGERLSSGISVRSSFVARRRIPMMAGRQFVVLRGKRVMFCAGVLLGPHALSPCHFVRVTCTGVVGNRT